MADYTGSRRVGPIDPFAEDDARLTCPKCGAGVRPDQEWCSLCLHVLRPPTPEPVPAVIAAGADAGGEGAEVAAAPRVAPEQVEAAATALLAQLAAETSRQRPTVPSYLDSNLKVGVAVTVAIAAFCTVVLVGLTVLGAVLR